VNAGKGRLVIALCTRGRPDELLRASRSISESCRAGDVTALAVLVIDSGPLSGDQVAEVLAALAGSAERVEHVDVAGRSKSLYQSRIIALRKANELGASHVAFFDDDVELMPDYMSRLAELLGRRPALVGGIDVELRMPSRASRAWNRLIGVSSGNAAKLSASGFGGSMPLWSSRTDPFESEYVSGCNMTIDARVLERLSPEADRIFVTYSLGEDLYLSARAAELGAVMIDPRLRVRHHVSPRAREERVEHGRQFMVNSAWLARQTNRSPLMFTWSAVGLAVRALVQDVSLGRPRGKMIGMLKGAREAARLLLDPRRG
jgi:hypothetical protein